MNLDDEAPDNKAQFPSASSHPHKNLRGIHDIDLIVSGKRQRKPSDKLTFAEKLKITFKHKKLGRHGLRLRPTASKKLNHIFGNRSEYTRVESHVNFDKIREGGFFENIHKKLKKGEGLIDSETKETIIPFQTRRHEAKERRYLLNPLRSQSIRDYPEKRIDMKRMKQIKDLKKNSDQESGEMQNTPETGRASSKLPERRSKMMAYARKIGTRAFGNFGRRILKGRPKKKQEINSKSSKRQSEPNITQLLQTTNQKRGQTTDKTQNVAQDEESQFSEAISKVAAIINFSKVPRELKKLMTSTDLKFISKDNVNGTGKMKEEEKVQESSAALKNRGVSKSPKKSLDFKGNARSKSAAKEADKNDEISNQRISKGMKEPQKMIRAEDSSSKGSPEKSELKSLKGNLFNRAQGGKSQKLLIKNQKTHLLLPEEQLGPLLKTANSRKKTNQEQEQQQEAEDRPLDLQVLHKTAENITYFNEAQKNIRTYINCDLRYFNFDFLVDKVGHFDVILVDPPWRIRGAQQNDSPFMFSNSKFNLEYDTLSHQEIMNIRVDKLSRKGFIFLWIISNQMNAAYEILSRWGYDVVDQIIWVKMKDSKIYLSHGYYFMHSFEMCLVGYKCPAGEYVEYNSKISNNIIFSEVRKKSQKPDQLYEIIELLMPGSRKIEIFARNHNLRPGWFSLGNQLGDLYDKWFNIVQCNECKEGIRLGVKRYKAKRQANYDVCEKCFGEKGLNISNFLEMKNEVDEDVLHQYHSCNKCNSEPIWGTRFTCKDCDNYDLCEGCFDTNLQPETKFHDSAHEFKIFEIPVLADGLPAHADKKCYGCFQKPIVGTCFSCNECPSLHFCQNCFFTKPIETIKKFRGHQPVHRFEIIVNPDFGRVDTYKCQWCEIAPIAGMVYKCDHCFNFYFCEKCYLKRQLYRPNIATSHKLYHSFTRLNAS